MNSACIAVLSPVKVPEVNIKPKETAARLSLLARQAAVFSAKEQRLPEPHFLKDEEGAPISENGIYWSISHKSTCVAGVVAIFPVGIDVEKIKPMKKQMFDRIASGKEWSLFEEKTQHSFFQVWTAKEAVLKAVGVGYKGIESCRIQEIVSSEKIRVAYENGLWWVSFFYIKDHIAAVSVKEPINIFWKTYP